MTWLLVALGGGAGASARHLLDSVARRRWPGFPWGVLMVNVTGSFALGLLAGAEVGAQAAALLATGFCGAFTTWSTLALDVVALGHERRWWAMVGDLAGSLVAGLAAVSLGVLLGSSLV